MLVLDTDHLTILQGQTKETAILSARLAKAEGEGHAVATTIITVQEQIQGWLSAINNQSNSRHASRQVEYYDRLQKILVYFSYWQVLPFDGVAAAKFNELRSSVPAAVGAMDLKIAAISLCNKATLLSRNSRDFDRVPGLTVEDWTVQI